jgi:hypothetical protein
MKGGVNKKDNIKKKQKGEAGTHMDIRAAA